MIAGRIYRKRRRRIGHIWRLEGTGVAVRVKIRIKSKRTGRTVETAALVNSGFKTDTAQLLIPLRLAERLGLWPPSLEVRRDEYGTSGGDVTLYVIPNELIVSVVAENRESDEVMCDAVISHIEREIPLTTS
ncbi:MAG: hypothetical protein ACTSXJ_08830 [Candidatus Baldrarchaeia archaeon]